MRFTPRTGFKRLGKGLGTRLWLKYHETLQGIYLVPIASAGACMSEIKGSGLFVSKSPDPFILFLVEGHRSTVFKLRLPSTHEICTFTSQCSEFNMNNAILPKSPQVVKSRKSYYQASTGIISR